MRSEVFSSSTTRALIADIKDEGMFEQLAASVLRTQSELYNSICNTGTNAEGKTITDPADGVTFGTDANGKRYAIIVHHTCTNRSGLRGKWLTAKDSDFQKALGEFGKFKSRLAKTYQPRLILTCTQTPNSELVKDVHLKADEHGIEVDVWSGDRLAEVLDTTRKGQWLRQQYLGVSHDHLSKGLLKDIGRRMVEDVRPYADPAERVPRTVSKLLDQLLTGPNQTVFLVGQSGTGKTVLCYDYAKQLEVKGNVCLVIDEQTLENTRTLEEALRSCISAYAPSVSESEITAALNEIGEDTQIIIWIEDINRAKDPTGLIRKLRTWSPNSKSENRRDRSVSAWSFICPIWPGSLEFLTKEERKAIDLQSTLIETYDSHEAVSAIQKKALLKGLKLTELVAKNIAEALGNDPLLIGLIEDFQTSSPSSVMSVFVENSLKRCSDRSGVKIVELRSALSEILKYIICVRNFSPNWMQLREHLNRADLLFAGEMLLEHSSIASCNALGSVLFRHDRIRDYVLACEIHTMWLSGEVDSSILHDPYFSRVLGMCLLNFQSTVELAAQAAEVAPLALFHGLAFSFYETGNFDSTLLSLCSSYISSEEFGNCPNLSVFTIHRILSELDGEEVLKLLLLSPHEDFVKLYGLARNGDVISACRICYSSDPEVNDPGRDRVLAHARNQFRGAWIQRIADLNSLDEKSEKIKEGWLNLMGEIGDEDFIPALKRVWQHDVENGKALSSRLLFAVITCASGRDESFIDEIGQAWSALPDDHPEEDHSNPRYDVAMYRLRFGLQRHERARCIKSLTRLAKNFPNLQGIIVQVLSVIDHPLAVQHTVEYAAALEKRLEGTDRFSPWLSDFGVEWGRRRFRDTLTLSVQTRDHLKLIWTDDDRNKYIRKRALQLWGAKISNEDAKSLSEAPPAGLEDEALIVRLTHGDKSSIPELAERILGKEFGSRYWLQFSRYVGTHGLEDVFIQLFELRKQFFEQKIGEYFECDYLLAELLGDRRDQFAENLLLENLEQVSGKREFVIALLYLSTPASLNAVEKSIDESDDKESLLAHLSMRMGIKVAQRSGLVSLSQVEAIKRYWHLIDDHNRSAIWDACNKNGWFDWRKRNLDALVLSENSRVKHLIDEDFDLQMQSKSFTDDRRRPDIDAHYWIEQRNEAGISSDELIHRAEMFATKLRSSSSFAFLASVISEIGNRSDLAKLEAFRSSELMFDEATMKDTTFRVQLRTAV